MAQHTLTNTEHIAANTSEEEYETWFGVELQAAEDYNPLTFTAVGGFFSFSGEGAGEVTVEADSGLHTEANFPQGDPGYYVHVIRPPGAAACDLMLTLVYNRLLT